MEPLGLKVPSAESIGACSLDMEASDCQRRDWDKLTKDVSELTLRSMAVSGDSGGNLSPQRHGTPDGSAVQLSNGYLKAGGSTVERWSSSTMEHKPSYLGISCAVNGYTSYSQFCRSRDPSPITRTNRMPSPLHMERTRLQKNEVTTNGKCSSVTPEAGPTRSLVQQRIATLYGAEAAERVARSRTRTSAARQPNIDLAVGKRSQSCSAQAVRGRSRSPPVFKHLTKNFREHLRLTEVSASPVESLPGYVVPSTKASDVAEEAPARSDIVNSKGVSHNGGDLAFVQGEDVPDRCVHKSARLNGCTEAAGLSGKAEPILPQASPSGENEGHAFLKILGDTQRGLEARIQAAELDLAQEGLPEDARGHLLSAVGKANLLISQKMQHFKELCLKNIEHDSSDPFPTTGADLAGFWDMVMLQVEKVHSVFDALSKLKQNNWVEPVAVETPASKTQPKFVKKGGSRSVPASPKQSAKADSIAKARAEARKRLMEAKRMAAKQGDQSGEGDIAIYTTKKQEDS